MKLQDRRMLEAIDEESSEEEGDGGGGEEEEDPPRCSMCGYKYSCATCVLYSLATRWATGSSSSTTTSLGTPTPWPSPRGSSSPEPGPPPIRASSSYDGESSSTSPAYPQQAHWLHWPSLPPGAPLHTGMCVICDVHWAFPLDDPPRQLTERCTHEARVCEECVLRWMGYMIHDQRPLRCPVMGCFEELGNGDVKYWAPEETYDRYETLQLRRALAAEPAFHWCLNPRCPSGQFHSPSLSRECESAMLTCGACSARSCAKHQIPWHEGLTCEKYEKKHEGWLDPVRRRERRVRGWMGRKTKQCPGCGNHIEKRDGCDHMTCRPPVGCNAQFCWRCGADYTVIFMHGNSGHKKHCKHYRPRVRFSWKFWRRNRRAFNFDGI
ncbi:hypothetical protein CALVIDRAFT_539788 [Calocera viscosa TUFC12733]|uniref:RBR-type E3 ubiquitin transferase n=1 Tax=Calocera viscosa (strain TUFC12733) TaxID=1330018 RepID=A0A167JI89_CALVF|nr:hypothetical protein CALVIDRAFT_539788 [Calocera viscosa TUFC12733]